MKTAFADTVYWVALLDPSDRWHQQARTAGRRLGITHITTTQEVLVEVLAFFSGQGAGMRRRAAALVRGILDDRMVTVINQSDSSFLGGLGMYEARLDKDYSAVDCISMAAMRRERLTEVLTHDHHFEQEGYDLLLVEGAK